MKPEEKDVLKKAVENSFEIKEKFFEYYISSKENLMNQQFYLLLTVNIISLTIACSMIFSNVINNNTVFFWSLIISTIFLTVYTISLIKETIDEFDKNLNTEQENITNITNELINNVLDSIRNTDINTFYKFIENKNKQDYSIKNEQSYQGEIVYFLFILILLNSIFLFFNLMFNLDYNYQFLIEIFIIIFSFNFSLENWSYKFTKKVSEIIESEKN